MNLSTPESLQKLQKALHAKAKESPDYRFYALYDKVYRKDVLFHAYHAARPIRAGGRGRADIRGHRAVRAGTMAGRTDGEAEKRRRIEPAAVRRVYIPKAARGTAAFEDKVLQRAVAMELEAVYEQSFLDCSYGFRPRRSAHQALRLVQSQTVKMAGRWVLEIDIRKFFDTLDHRQLRDIVRKRVRDGVLLRLIGKWLNAGVMEDGAIAYPDAGTPQGGVISPLLANIYLHEVLDEWFAREVVPRLIGRAVLVRYADDVVIIFGNEQDARRVCNVLPKRFAKYGLTLHPEKTRLVDFRRPDRRDSPSPDGEARARGSAPSTCWASPTTGPSPAGAIGW